MSGTVLIVDDEQNAQDFISEFLQGRGYETISAGTLQEAREHLQQGNADVIILDVLLPDGSGPSLLEETQHILNRPPIILLTAHGDIEMAVEAMKNGATDFLQKPIRLAQVDKSVERAMKNVSMHREWEYLMGRQAINTDFVVGKSRAIHTLLELARRAADVSAPILITGETGTGKGVLAKAIHDAGPRAKKLFVDINCANFQPSVLETELFGYEKGAFTDAKTKKDGLMQTADGGTLFLDEIANMTLEIQAKVLTAIDKQTFRRVGGHNNIKVDTHIITASNRDLQVMIREGAFREDLYYRLKVVQLHMPPLRKRKEDIPELVSFFLKRANQRMGKNITDVTSRAMETMLVHDWPGNIRELENVIDHASLFCDDWAIDLSHLPAELQRGRDGSGC